MMKIMTEFLGTAFLVMIVLGSGFMGQTLFPAQTGLALFVNSISTVFGLFSLIISLGPISGAHLNPVVSFVDYLLGKMSLTESLKYMVAQFIGAYLGIILVHVMFNLQIFTISEIDRSGSHLLVSEVIATFGLMCVIHFSGKNNSNFQAMSTAAYIGAAYWFTSSTAFTNPAVTFARIFTNTFGGMAPTHFLSFFLAQFLGAFISWFCIKKIARFS